MQRTDFRRMGVRTLAFKAVFALNYGRPAQ